MTLLYIDGFDARDTSLTGRWLQDTNFNQTLTYGTGRFSGSCVGMGCSSSGALYKRSITPSAQVYVGFALQSQVTVYGTAIFGAYGDSGTVMHFNVRRTATFQLQLYNGNTLISTSAANVFDANWHYFEFMTTIADTGGRAVVKVDGATIFDYTGDTRNGGTSTNIDAICIAGGGNNGSGSLFNWFDDLYICDALGTANNTFLGDVRVQSLVPTGAGTTTQLTPSTGANWAAVDELPYSATDYVTGLAVGNKDTYATLDIAAGYAVKGVQLCAIAKKTDAGTRSLKTVARSAGTDYSGGSTTLSTADTVAIRLLENDPATAAAWTTAGINAMEIGVEVA